MELVIWSMFDVTASLSDNIVKGDNFMPKYVLVMFHTLRVHYAHAAANLNSGYLRYAKALFLYNCTPNISRSADASVSVA